MTVDAHGPWLPHYTFTVDGYKVPNLTGTLADGENTWNLVYDGRFCIMVSQQELQPVVWMIANVAAVNAGFTCHGEHSQPLNPFRTELRKIEGAEADEQSLPGVWDEWLGDDDAE